MKLSADLRVAMDGRRRQAAADLRWDRTSLVGDTAPAASLVCLFGLLLHFVLSYPLLDALGVLDSAQGGPPWQKIHPGSICIITSLLVLLSSRGDPISRFAEVSWKLPAFCITLAINLLLSVWVVYRSGIAGISVMVDTHWTPAIAAIVLSYAPRGMLRRGLYVFIGLTALNSGIGIYEGVFRVRVLSFDPTWSVLHEQYFRASALIGHPLTNGQLTSIAIFGPARHEHFRAGESAFGRHLFPVPRGFWRSNCACVLGGRIGRLGHPSGTECDPFRTSVRAWHMATAGEPDCPSDRPYWWPVHTDRFLPRGPTCRNRALGPERGRSGRRT